MEPWGEAFRELRGQFVRESGARLDEIQGLLDLLAQSPVDGAALHELMRRFHAFAGSGTTYGLPRVTALGLEGERACATLEQQRLSPKTQDLERWRKLLASLRFAFAGTVGEAASADLAPAPTAGPASRPADILVVDDDEVLCTFLIGRIEQEGMVARAATTKAEAVRAVEARMPDGIIVDVRLPDGSGYELVEHVRGLPQGDLPAILVVSVLTGFLDKVEAVHCGADGFFEKPVNWEGLMRRLQHLLEKRPEPARILSVEDDPHQSSFLRTVLESAGYEVCICEDPHRFEADLLSFRPDLVLMDIVLPGISGYDLVRYVRQDERHATLPVLFLTTEAQLTARIESARAGGDEHFLKPIPPALLLSVAATRIERARFVKSLLGRDGLTRLLTHTAFHERAAVALAHARRHPERSVAWVMIDLDNFKSINDRYGHPTGDRVLVSVSALLRRHLRQSDTIGRYGGEEFAVLLHDLEEEQAVRLVTRLLEQFAAQEHTAPDGSKFTAAFSAGVAMLDPASMDLNRWKQGADSALYAAKAGGRGQVVASPPPGASSRPPDP